jgi:amino acid transporter
MFSPFALAADLANLEGFGHFYNAAIVCALLSMANMGVYSTSRALQAIAHEGMAPKFLEKISKRGIPTYALVVTLLFGLSAFLNCIKGGEQMFDWILTICAHFDFYIWISINAAYIRFRAAMKKQGKSTDDLIWTNPFGAVGSYVAIAIAAVAILSNSVALAVPVDKDKELTKGVLATKIVRENAGIIIPWLFWGCATLYSVFLKKDSSGFRFFTPLEELDIDTGRLRKEEDLETNGETAANR